MKTTDQAQLLSIDTAALEDVTGGCAACGQDCAKGQAPTAAVNPQQQNARSPWNTQSRG